jgi:hypothetical protein
MGFEFLLGGGESGVTSGTNGTIGNGRMGFAILEEDKSEGAATVALEEKVKLSSLSSLLRTSDSSLKDKIFSPIGVAG